MRRFTALAVSVFALGLLAVMMPVIGGAHAEGFADIRIGRADTQDTNGTSKSGPVGGPPQSVWSGTVEFKPGVSFGIRGGYWLDSVPWLGFALDFSYFDPDEDAPESVKFGVFPISGLLMVRYPLLKDSDYPRGRLQPYAGAGPGAFVTTAKIKAEGEKDFSDTTVAAGADVRGGINIHYTGLTLPGESFAFFLEYRFTHFEPSDFEDNIGNVLIELESDSWNTHHFTAGVGWYF